MGGKRANLQTAAGEAPDSTQFVHATQADNVRRPHQTLSHHQQQRSAARYQAGFISVLPE